MQQYKDVIDILTSNVDFKAICIMIGKNDPDVLLKAATDMGIHIGINKKIIDLCIAGLRIRAIKLHRETFNSGLVEAKDYVDKVYSTYKASIIE